MVEKGIVNKEKSSWHLTSGTAADHVNKVIERIRIERLPICIDEVIVFGSFIKEKLNPHDVDFLLVKRNPQPDDYNDAYQIFSRLIKYFDRPKYEYRLSLYGRWKITVQLIRRGMKGIHPTDTDGVLEFIHELGDRENLLKSGFPMKVVWSSSWEGELPRDKKHPLIPYLRFMQITNDKGIYRDMKKVDERVKILSTYNGGDWKVLLNEEENRCYKDVTKKVLRDRNGRNDTSL